MLAGDTHPVDSLLNLARGSDVYIEQCMGPIKDFAALPNNSQYLLNVRFHPSPPDTKLVLEPLRW